ncbi:hypothetical protein ACI65C_006810 [Semiaphis heraclei]
MTSGHRRRLIRNQLNYNIAQIEEFDQFHNDAGIGIVPPSSSEPDISLNESLCYASDIEPQNMSNIFKSHLASWATKENITLKAMDERSKSYHLENESINLMFNIDGLLLSRSSYNEIWPILGSIFKVNYVFIIGIYHSQVKKPTDIYAYLEDFIKEINNLILNGFTYEEK